MRERVTLMVVGPGARNDDCGRLAACLTVPGVDGWPSAACPVGCASYAPPAAWQRIAAHFDGLGSSPLAAAEEVDDEEEPKVKPTQARGASARIVAALAAGPLAVREIAVAVGVQDAEGRHRFRRVGALLSQLRQSGLVSRVSRGVWGLA